MMLWERGLLELTDPVSRWLPEFADPRVYVKGSSTKPADSNRQPSRSGCGTC